MTKKQKPKNDFVEIKPQPRQEQFLSSSADIAIFGGSAFGGKTWALEVEPLRHINVKGFGAVIFRRTTPEITREGGLWDEAGKIYPLFGGRPNQAEHFYRFPSGVKISFSHMQNESDKESWKSAQIPLIIFDQLETFSSGQFFYMFSRNRSTCGIRPYIRASANPQPGWLADFLAWWIDGDGWAIPERSGVIRWLLRENNQEFWADTKEELLENHPGAIEADILSVTFILSTIYDNKIGMKMDPGYLGKLKATDHIDRMRLLGEGEKGGNWKVTPAAGKVFNRAWFEIVDGVPPGGREMRFWDLAATADELADFTASCKAKYINGIFWILDATADQTEPAKTDEAMKNKASQDGKGTAIRWEREGGASGKRDSRHIATMLRGYDVRGVSPQGDKITRAKPLASQAEAGNVKLLRGDWNERWLRHMHSQDGSPKTHDDEMDAASGCFNELVEDSPAITVIKYA